MLTTASRLREMLINKLATAPVEDIVISRSDAIMLRALLENAIHRQSTIDKMWNWMKAQKEEPSPLTGRPK